MSINFHINYLVIITSINKIITIKCYYNYFDCNNINILSIIIYVNVPTISRIH